MFTASKVFTASKCCLSLWSVAAISPTLLSVSLSTKWSEQGLQVRISLLRVRFTPLLRMRRHVMITWLTLRSLCSSWTRHWLGTTRVGHQILSMVREMGSIWGYYYYNNRSIIPRFRKQWTWKNCTIVERFKLEICHISRYNRSHISQSFC